MGRYSLVLGVGIAFLSWIPRISSSSVAMSRGGWGEFVDGGSTIARDKRMVLHQGGAIGAGVISLRMWMLVVVVVRMGGTLTGD